MGLMTYAGHRFYMARAEWKKSIVTLENVEALSRSESEATYVNCCDNIHYKAGYRVVYCVTCEDTPNYTDDLTCIHSKCQQ